MFGIINGQEINGSGDSNAYAEIGSPLGALSVLGYHDFSGAVGELTTRYVLDLIDAEGVAVRVPSSSWQATLQTDISSYVQCVIPACNDWVDTINEAVEFVVYRRAELPDGSVVEYEMARAPLEQARFDRGPERYTCTISGYSEAFAADEDPAPTFDRTLTGIRSISTGQGTRVRCSIDWLLRPGQRAFADDLDFVVGYINYYVPGFDGYMDVGTRA